MNLTPPASRSNSRPSSSQRQVPQPLVSRPGSAASKSSVGSGGRQRSKIAPTPKALQAWGDGSASLTTPKSVKSNNFFRQVSNDDFQDMNLDGRDFGWSVAHQACHQGHLLQVRMLARKGDALLRKCQAGNSVLHVAARSGQLEVLRFLLSQKQVSIDGKNKNGWTPLMWAAIVGNTECADLLIQAACDIYARDEKSMTALMWAAKHGHQDIARLLLNAGEHTGRKDQRGWLAADHAQNHSAMLTLLEAVTRVNQRMLSAAQRNDEEEVAVCLREGAQVNHVDAEGRSALLWAAVHGSVTMLHLLFRFGASTKVLEACVTELDNAINQHRQVVDVLQAADGANARLLHSASLADWPGVRLALEQCAFVNTRDADHRTAISWAASFGAADIIRLLVKQKAQVGMMDAFGWQPFHFAVSGRHVEATALLFHANAALDVETFEGDSPLQMAIQADDASLVQMLLACSAQVDGANLQLTQLATLRGCASALHVLLMYKANPEVVDEQGQSLLHLAASKGHLPVLKLLLKPLTPLPKVPQEQLLETRLKKVTGDRLQALAVSDVASVAESVASDQSGSSNNDRPASPSKISSPTKGRSSRRLNSGGEKAKKRRPSTSLTTEEKMAAGPLLMLLKARKQRIALASSTPTPFSAKALNEGKSVLCTAVSHGHSHLVKPLINLQADPNSVDYRGSTPLMLAASAGDLASVAALVEGGASLTQKNGHGQRALDVAATVAVRAALLTATVRKIAGLPRPLSATALKPIRVDERRRSSAVEYHRFRLGDLPETLGTAELLEGHIRALMRRVGMPKPDVLDIPVDPIRRRALGIAYLEYLDINAADKAEKMFVQAKDVKGPTGTTASLAREGPCLRRSRPPSGVRSNEAFHR